MTVENISRSISTKECCRPRRGGGGGETATSWSPAGRRIQLSHRGRPLLVCNADSVGPNQTTRSVSSNQGLYCFSVSLLWDARHK